MCDETSVCTNSKNKFLASQGYICKIRTALHEGVNVGIVSDPLANRVV